MAHRVVAVVYEGISMFEFGIVTEAFALRRPELGVPWYEFGVCSLQRGPVRALGGIAVEATRGLGALRAADTIVMPGWSDLHGEPPARLVAAVRNASQRGARVVSICSGVFVLAAAGILDGKRATTHWRYAAELARRFPAIRVEPDVLYVDEGQILTSAGSAAGIDLCLHIIRRDYGAAIANTVAKRLVVPPHRDGGQAQFVSTPIAHDSSRSLASIIDWAQANLGRVLTISKLARQAHMSPRSFARHFKAETGTTPYRWLLHQRLLAAQRCLETSDDSIDRVAERVGMQTAVTLRHHFHKTFRTTPTAYRRRFTTVPK